MKFEEYLETNAVPEWREKYVHYAEIKRVIDENAPETHERHHFHHTGEDEERMVESGFHSENEFGLQQDVYEMLQRDLEMVNEFFKQKEHDALQRYDVLYDQVQAYKDVQLHKKSRNTLFNFNGTEKNAEPEPPANPEQPMFTVGMSNRKWLVKMRKAFREYYRSLSILRNYQLQNYTAFVKSIKKHDKSFRTNTRSYLLHVEQAPFYSSSAPVSMMESTQILYTSLTGNSKKSSKDLKMSGHKNYEWSTFRLGVYLGITIPVVSVVCFEMFRQLEGLPFAVPVLRMFRGIFLPCFLVWYYGIDASVWHAIRVNYLFIFEKDPRKSLSYHQVLEIGSGLLVTCWLAALIYMMCSAVAIFPPQYVPMVLALGLVIFMIWPFRSPYRASRYWILSRMWKIICAPFYKVKFADFWLADQFVSLELALLDWQYMICFYLHPNSYESCTSVRSAVRPIISMLPSWFRVAQCFRRYHDAEKHKNTHLWNAGKYSMTFIVVIFSSLDTATLETGNHIMAYRYIWVSFGIISTFYSLYWDLVHDWGVMHRDSKNFMLRDKLLMPPPVYYVAIGLDVVLRFFWVTPLLPNQLINLAFGHPEVLKTVSGFLGVFRRGLWNVFRLENEHLHNCGEFRTVHEVPLPELVPLQDDDGADTLSLPGNRGSVGGRFELLKEQWLPSLTNQVTGAGGRTNGVFGGTSKEL